MIKKIIFSIVIAILFTSCATGFYSNYNFTYFDAVKSEQYNKVQLKLPSIKFSKQQIDSVLIFLEGEKNDFEFEKVGIIEVKGAEHSQVEDLIIELKTVTKQRNCDAIINLR